MNQTYLKAVEDAFVGVMGSMAGIDVVAEQAELKRSSEALINDSITGIISLNGSNLNFSVALTLPKKIAVAVAQQMLQGMAIDEEHPMIVDLVGEMANLVVGGAKNVLDSGGDGLVLSLPTTIDGSDYSIGHQTESAVWVVRFTSELGDVFVEASYRALN